MGEENFVSSVATFTGGVVGSHYTASKAALIGLMHVLAGPLVPHGVTVSAIAPALTKGGATVTGGEDAQRQFAKYTPRGPFYCGPGFLGRQRDVPPLVS